MTASKHNQYSVCPLKRIIQDMAQLYNVYRLVKASDKRAKQLEKEDPQAAKNPDGTFRRINAGLAYTKRCYKKRRRTGLKISDRNADIAFHQAIDKQYLKIVTDYELGQQVKTYKIEDKGLDLIDKSLVALPKGLLIAWSDKNGKFNNFIWGLIGGIVGGITIATVIIKIFHL